MCATIYCTVLLAVGMMTQTRAFMHEDVQHHKKVIIHVPVVTHTIYKIIEKGGRHKHGGNVIHHHHHGGHVAHIHKHEGEATHKHHHAGSAGHHHKHTGLAGHKHVHTGKGEHSHHHKGHLFGDHHHKGYHGHDHKHAGVFSSAHTHTGTGTHSHGHHGEGHHAHKHSGHFGHGHGNFAGGHIMDHLGYLTDPTNLLTFQPPMPVDHNAALLGQAPPPPVFHKYDQNTIYGPYSGGWIPQYAPFSAYPPADGYKIAPSYHQNTQLNYIPEYANEYSNMKSHGGVTTYAVQNSKQTVNTEYEEHPKTKKHKKIKKTKFTLFNPSAPAAVEGPIQPPPMPSLPTFDDIGESLEEDKFSTSVPEFDSHEIGGYEEGYSDDSEEVDMGAYQSPVKSQVLPPKRRANQKFVVPVVPYEVTEATTPSFF